MTKLTKPDNCKKQINEWNKYSKEVDAQTTKQKVYDNVFIKFCKDDIVNKKVLDFGCGTGEIAQRVKQLSSEIKVYDESREMRKSASVKLGINNVYNNINEIPKKHFDVLLSSLVICIVKEIELKKIMQTMSDSLKNNGVAYIGLCNPKDYDIAETSLQFRLLKNKSYEEKHEYKKLIKEGEFEITEQHRPLEFYDKLFERFGFKINDVRYSIPEVINDLEHSDFIMYKLKKTSPIVREL